MMSMQGTDLCILQRLKGLSLAGRGISFTQTDQLREALRDLQLSIQAFPGKHHSCNLTCNECDNVNINAQEQKQIKVSQMPFRPILENYGLPFEQC